MNAGFSDLFGLLGLWLSGRAVRQAGRLVVEELDANLEVTGLAHNLTVAELDSNLTIEILEVN